MLSVMVVGFLREGNDSFNFNGRLLLKAVKPSTKFSFFEGPLGHRVTIVVDTFIRSGRYFRRVGTM